MSSSDPPSPPPTMHAPARMPAFTLLFSFLLVACMGVWLMVWRQDQMRLTAAEEKNHLLAAHIVQFGQLVEVGIARLKMQGVALEQVDFSPEGMGEKALFNTHGGAVTFQPPPDMGSLPERWTFHLVMPDGRGWFIAGAGQDTPGGQDVIMTLNNIPLAVCEQINARLGLAKEPARQLIAVDLAIPGDTAWSAGQNNATFFMPPHAKGACIQNGDKGPYVFYHLIAAR